MNMPPTIAEQIDRMKQRYPDFRVDACDWMATWTGELSPIRRPYTVQVSFIRRSWINGLELIYGYVPRVRLLNPKLEVRHHRTGEFAHHVYWDFNDLERSPLCLYDPAADPPEWRWDRDFIADRIIPFTANWLACYESWQATGEWTGGGRHPESRRNSCLSTTIHKAEPNRAPLESPRRDAFHWIGRRIIRTTNGAHEQPSD